MLFKHFFKLTSAKVPGIVVRATAEVEQVVVYRFVDTIRSFDNELVG